MSTRPVRDRTTLIVWHCSASGPNRDIGAADIDREHKARGWQAIGYHLVIRRNGRIETGEALNKVGAHVQGFNSVSVGVCMVGGVDANGKPENNFTPEQWATAKSVHDMLSRTYPDAQHVGHRDMSPDLNGDGMIQWNEWMKQCPCFSVERWLASGLQPQVGLGIGKDLLSHAHVDRKGKGLVKAPA